MSRLVLIAAGGTGGHLFPAEALALALTARGWRVHLATDHRVETYGHDFPAEKVHFIQSATLSRSPLVAAQALATLALGFVQARILIAREKPSVAIGFGGYPTVPPILAAAWAGADHRSRAERRARPRQPLPRPSRHPHCHQLRRGRRRRGAGGQGRPDRQPGSAGGARSRRHPYPARAPGDPFRLLVFGGSQGARFFSDLMPATVALIGKDMQAHLKITQQCRPEDVARVRQAYDLLGVAADLQPFFADMPQRIADSHLVVSRSGASTCAELAVIGRPAILVPLPHALDQDQKANANVLANAGGGWLIDQSELTPARLAGDITRFMKEPERLSTAAAAARAEGRPDAVDRLADLVEQVATVSA